MLKIKRDIEIQSNSKTYIFANEEQNALLASEIPMKNKSKLPEPLLNLSIVEETNTTKITTELRGKVLEVELSNFLDWAKANHLIALTEVRKEAIINMYLKPNP